MMTVRQRATRIHEITGVRPADADEIAFFHERNQP